MATKFKMAAIYQNKACCYCQLLLLKVKYLISVRYGLEKDSKHLTAVQQKNYTVKRDYKLTSAFKMAAKVVLKLAKITDFGICRLFFRPITTYSKVIGL